MRRSTWLPGLLILLVVVSACSTPAASPTANDTGSATASASESPLASPSGEPSDEATPSPSATATDAPADATLYTVRRGDTLASISRAFSTTTQQLQAWNSERYPSLATDPNVIEPGWELIVAGDPGVTPRPTATPAPATPRPTPPPSATGCTAGNRVAAGSAQTFRTIPNAGPGVALTFDMGGRMDPAVDIMNYLVANGVCATIFATGVMSNTSQGQQVLAIIKAHPELFEVGNHTMYHCDLVRGGGGSPTTAPCTGSFDANRIRTELTDAEAILRAGTGQNPQPYWRPPYGSISQGVIDAAASAGYTKAFLWDIDSIDWKPISDGGPTAEQIAAKVIGNAVNGSNVLFHIGGYETLDALHLIIPGLRDRGFTLTSLSDLLN
ncbi:MAG TPA: polysaccharide deacetylase family protein [Candidatus Limnocylindria bacterium]|nr:polysaccharide deacetylase family protein [Candidatus Limnocylindria bacterium]